MELIAKESLCNVAGGKLAIKMFSQKLSPDGGLVGVYTWRFPKTIQEAYEVEAENSLEKIIVYGAYKYGGKLNVFDIVEGDFTLTGEIIPTFGSVNEAVAWEQQNIIPEDQTPEH